MQLAPWQTGKDTSSGTSPALSTGLLCDSTDNQLIPGLQLPSDTSANPQTKENTAKTRETWLHSQNISQPMPAPPHLIPIRGSPKPQPQHLEQRPLSTYLTDSQPQYTGQQEMDKADWLRLSAHFLSSSSQAHHHKQYNQQSSEQYNYHPEQI